MVEPRWKPGDRRMTVVAGVVAGYVVGGLTSGRRAIVTTKTGAGHDIRVVEGRGRGPGDC